MYVTGLILWNFHVSITVPAWLKAVICIGWVASIVTIPLVVFIMICHRYEEQESKEKCMLVEVSAGSEAASFLILTSLNSAYRILSQS